MVVQFTVVQMTTARIFHSSLDHLNLYGVLESRPLAGGEENLAYSQDEGVTIINVVSL